MIASEKRNGKREFFLELRSMRCFQVSWVLVFFRKKHGGGCMITFGWGLEQGFFLELRNCLLACNLTTTILEFFFLACEHTLC